ncbi:MAG: hypothetical protein JW954_03340 [Dehalococcoidaceae bacterium]|nr:hypothetical protein [Dehalococcoidaceae bacterium]
MDKDWASLKDIKQSIHNMRLWSYDITNSSDYAYGWQNPSIVTDLLIPSSPFATGANIHDFTPGAFHHGFSFAIT